MEVTALEKKGPILYCYTDDPKGRCYKLDFARCGIYGLTGRAMKSADPILGKIDGFRFQHDPLYNVLRMFSMNIHQEHFPVIEALLSYPDLLPYPLDYGFIVNLTHRYGKLPKGYVAWCKSHDTKFDDTSLREFYTYDRTKDWPKNLADTVDKFFKGTRFNLAQAANFDPELCISLMRIIHNSMKRYELESLTGYIARICEFVTSEIYRSYLDDTKSAKVAYEILATIKAEKRNEIILQEQAKIALLDGVIVGGMMIKVPQSMDDFTNEGEQQHNCVGYFYHDSIAEGRNLIYFLRDPTTPDKSFLTCRFNRMDGATLEHRIKNNVWWEDKLLLAAVDELIRNTLKGAEG